MSFKQELCFVEQDWNESFEDDNFELLRSSWPPCRRHLDYYRGTYKQLHYKDFIEGIKKKIDKPNQLNYYISSRLNRFSHLLTVDCDGQKQFERAQSFLNDRKIDYVGIESSPGHYWIICNKKGRLKNLVRFLETIPGVDPKYSGCAYVNKGLVLRAFPKKLFIPKFVVYSYFSNVENTEFRRWVDNFYNYWHSEDMDEILNALFGEEMINQDKYSKKYVWF